MKDEATQAIRDALKTKGELSVDWECGCDSSIVNFGSWYTKNYSPEDPLNAHIDDLRYRIIDLLNLPGAGGLMDEGKGKIFFDEPDDSIKLTYSSRCAVYEIDKVELAEILRDRKNVSFAINDLEAEDFSFSIYIDEDTVDKDLFANFSPTPNLDESIVTAVVEKLKDHVPDFVTRYPFTNKTKSSDFLVCRILEVDGTWTSKNNKVVFTKWCGVEYLEHDVKDVTVKLA